MPATPRKRRYRGAAVALLLLVLAMCAAPTLSQSSAAGYCRLLRRHAAPQPTAVADCSVALLGLRAATPGAPIPDAAFAALAGRCRKAADAVRGVAATSGDEGGELGATGVGCPVDKEKYCLFWRSPSGV